MFTVPLSYVQQQIPAAPASDAAFLQSLIDAACPVIETYLQRQLSFGTYDELHTVSGPTCSIFVNNPPITTVIRMSNQLMPAMYVQCSDPASIVQFATVDVQPTQVVLTKMFNNVPTTATFTFTAYPTFASLAAGINLLGAGWTAQPIQQFNAWQTSELSTSQTGRSARNISLSLEVFWWRDYNQKCNKQLGEIWVPGLANRGYQSYRVQYTGGFATLPPEIMQATAELVQLMYSFRRLNPNMLTATLMDYSYTRMAENCIANLSLTSRLALNQHRRPRLTPRGVPAQL